MSTLSPVGRYGGGRGNRHRLRTALVLLVGLAALVAAGWFGYKLANRSDDTTATGPSTSTSTSASSCSPAAPSPTSTRKPKPPPKPKAITVNVYNSTTRSGLARKTADLLHDRGFMIGNVPNDHAPKPVVGIAEVRYGPKGVPAAHVVAAQVVGAKLVEDKRTSADVDLAVGAKYKKLATPAQVKAAMSPSARPTTSC
jgi:hypothetical protein